VLCNFDSALCCIARVVTPRYDPKHWCSIWLSAMLQSAESWHCAMQQRSKISWDCLFNGKFVKKSINYRHFCLATGFWNAIFLAFSAHRRMKNILQYHPTLLCNLVLNRFSSLHCSSYEAYTVLLSFLFVTVSMVWNSGRHQTGNTNGAWKKQLRPLFANYTLAPVQFNMTWMYQFP
jgi:hypothetical protein